MVNRLSFSFLVCPLLVGALFFLVTSFPLSSCSERGSRARGAPCEELRTDEEIRHRDLEVLLLVFPGLSTAPDLARILRVQILQLQSFLLDAALPGLDSGSRPGSSSALPFRHCFLLPLCFPRTVTVGSSPEDLS